MFTNSIKNRLARVASNQLVKTPQRGIKLHEYQAGALLNSYRVNIPLGEVAFTADEAHKIASGLPGGCVVKSQILGGGRGQGTFTDGFKGGVHLVNDAAGAKDIASKMLNNRLVTK